MDATVASNGVTFRTIGGVINYFVFVGPTPAAAVAQYHALLGPPTLIPYWGLGWHQCRYGYNTLEEVQAVVDNYKSHSIPLDVMWNDIDYMNSYYDWTVDPSRYPADQYKAFVNQLHADGQYYVPIVDAGVAQQTKLPDGSPYEAWNSGVEKNVFIGSPNHDGPLIGKCWPGYAAWPDFFNPNTTDWWVGEFLTFHDTLPYDGVWLDMNEPSNFCVGECNY
jgi:alpha-glucosidase (family GH31 glycosyl hydrolase)